MMLIVIFFVIFTIIGKIIEKTWINPLSFFSLLWAAVVSLAKLQLYDMTQVSDKTYIIIGMGVLSYFIGYLIFYAHPFRICLGNIGRQESNSEILFSSREQLFRWLFIVTFIVWAFLGMITIFELLSGIPYRQIRDMYGGSGTEDHLFSNQYTALLVKWFFVPAVHVIVAKIIYSFFDEHYKWHYYLCGFFLLILYCLTTGSRMILLYVVFQLLFLLYLNKHNNPVFFIKRSVKRKLKWVMFLAIGGIILITLLRPADTSSSDWTTKQTLYAYVSLAVPLLDYWVWYVDHLAVRTYGVSFFRGILELLARFKFPLPTQYTVSSQLISYCSDTYVPVFGAKVFNAFVSVFFYFYLDFGYAGVVLGSIIFGMLSCSIYRNTRNKRNEYKTVLFLIYLMTIIGSFARWQFINPAYVIMFFIVRLLYKKQKIREIE